MTDVLVVGAGLAGLHTATGLARRGHDVLLVDRRSRLDGAVRTTGIFVARTLADFPLPAAHLGPPISRVVLHPPSGRRAVVLGQPAHRVPGRRHGRAVPGRRPRRRRGRRAHRPVHPLPRPGRRRVAAGRPGRGTRRARPVPGRGRRRPLPGGRRARPGPQPAAAGRRRGGLRRPPARPPPAFHCVLDPVLAPGYLAWVVDDGEHVHVGTAATPTATRRACPRRCAGSPRPHPVCTTPSPRTPSAAVGHPGRPGPARRRSAPRSGCRSEASPGLPAPGPPRLTSRTPVPHPPPRRPRGRRSGPAGRSPHRPAPGCRPGGERSGGARRGVARAGCPRGRAPGRRSASGWRQAGTPAGPSGPRAGGAARSGTRFRPARQRSPHGRSSPPPQHSAVRGCRPPRARSVRCRPRARPSPGVGAHQHRHRRPPGLLAVGGSRPAARLSAWCPGSHRARTQGTASSAAGGRPPAPGVQPRASETRSAAVTSTGPTTPASTVWSTKMTARARRPTRRDGGPGRRRPACRG